MRTVLKSTGVHLLFAVLLVAAPAGIAYPRESPVHAAAVTVVNAASYETQVAPGSIAALFSSSLTNQAGEAAATIPLPATLAGLSVRINGVVAPLFYASATQVNLQIPGAAPVGNATVEVFNTGNATPVATGSVSIADSAPGVFTINATGRDQAAALNSDSSINAAFDVVPGSHPEVTGNYVTIFATGVGNTNPMVADGAAAPTNVLAVATSTTTVVIGGTSAQVLYSGLAPGFVGLWQINAFLPGSLATNFATPMKVDLRGKMSLETTLAVASKSEYGTATGTVVSALSGTPIAGASVTLQPVSGTTVRSATTDASGAFSVLLVKAGNYNATATATGYVTATQAVGVIGAQTEQLPAIALTEPLAAGQYRVVVTWYPAIPGIDLDAHVTGPSAGGGKFHVWWNGEIDAVQSPTTRLDRDDLTGAGPETITFSPQAGGSYRFSVHNYTDRDLPGSTRLFNSRAIVRVYRGSQQIAVLSAPTGGGTLWKVFESIGDQVTIINQLTDEFEPSNVKTSF
ncbi:MAG: carboxypeptidase regulatory-like domain-containing protein [Acidobacteriota bacterium]